MRLVAYESEDGPRVGVVEGDVVREAGTSLFDARPGEEVGTLSSVSVLSPVGRPGKVVCVGLNYRDHAAESGLPVPESPVIFSKFGTSVIGPGVAVVIPPITEQVDYKAELGVVIGRTAKAVGVREAIHHVLGYTCVNDVSARDLQFSDGQFIRGKSLDTFCPVGPAIVTADEVPDPDDLGISCRLNGEVLQESSTSEMVFSVAELISFISQGITLEPGDLIATGTPSGVGVARHSQVFLKDGDVVRVEVEGIGVLENTVRKL